MKKQGRGFIWAEKEEQHLIDNYSDQNKEDLIKYFNRSWQAITRKASKLKLKRDIMKRQYNRGWTQEEEQYLRDHYEFGDLNEIAKKFNRTRKAITERAKRLKITRDPETVRKQSQKYEVNEDFFKIWTGDMAYTLGLICADGNITQPENGNRLSIALHKNDAHLIKDIYLSMNSTHKVNYCKDINMVTLCIENKHIYNDLMKLGIIPAKSKTLGDIKVPEKYIADFLRGVLDGDGSVSTKGKRAKIGTASKEFADCMVNMLNEIKVDHKLYNDSYVYKGIKTDFYIVRVLRLQAVKRLYELMYKDANLFLTRKKKAFEDMGIKEDNFTVKCYTRFRPVIGTNINTNETIRFGSLKEAMENGFLKQMIYRTMKGRYKEYKGYKWKYAQGDK